MATGVSRRGLRPVLLLAAVVLSLSAVFITAFQAKFGMPWAIVPAHLGLVAGALAIVLVLVGVLQAAVRTPRRLTTLPLALFVATLAFLDLIHWIGRTVWMEVLSFRTFVFYAPRIYGIAEGAVNYHGLWLLWATFAAVGVVFVAVLCAGGPVSRAIAYAVDPRGRALFGTTRPVLRGLLTLLLTGAGFVSAYVVLKDVPVLATEPIAALFPPERSAPLVAKSSEASGPLLPTAGDGPVSQSSAAAPITVQPGRKSVVIIVVDSLRQDHMKMFGYERDTLPAIDAFTAAGPAVIADWSTSSCSISSCGILGILAGSQYQHQYIGMPNLPDVLRAAGYDTFFVSSGDFTHGYPVLHEMFGSTARIFADGFSSEKYKANDDRNIVDALAQLPTKQDKPGFFYFHLHSAHRGGSIYRPPTYRPSFVDTELFTLLTGMVEDGIRSRSEPVTFSQDVPAPDNAIIMNDYDNALLQADDVVGKILETLRARGYLDDSVVVLTADHGEQLMERGKLGHGFDLFAESINVPLIIRDPTFGNLRRVPYARQIDIAPTVLQCVGLPAPPAWDGESILDRVAAESFHQTTHAQPIQGVVWRSTQGTYKYWIDTGTRAESLFNLDTDAGEKTNLLRAADPRLLGTMRTAVQKNFSAAASAPAIRELPVETPVGAAMPH